MDSLMCTCVYMRDTFDGVLIELLFFLGFFSTLVVLITLWFFLSDAPIRKLLSLP